MHLPHELYKITENYFSQQCDEGNKLTEDERISLVEQLIQTYDKLAKPDRRVVLIPADGKFLKEKAIHKEVLYDGEVEYSFLYKWPSNAFEGCVYNCVLNKGEAYDRIGGEDGTYLAPIKKDGIPESYLARAIPYYIPEANIVDSPSYHCYIMKTNYGGEAEQNVKKGIIAQAFQISPRDGGGTQIKLPKMLASLKGVYFNEL